MTQADSQEKRRSYEETTQMQTAGGTSSRCVNSAALAEGREELQAPAEQQGE